MLIDKAPVAAYILMALGSLLVIVSSVVALTPSKKDDEFLEKVHGIPVLGQLVLALRKFSVIEKKKK
jgi:hypothetical protein